MDEVLNLEYAQRQFGDYDALSGSAFRSKLLTAGDSYFSTYFGRRFSISNFNSRGVGQEILANDLNYYYQGFITAAAGRSQYMMQAYIFGHNSVQALTRFDLYDVRQIGPASYWATYGYNFYKSAIGEN